MSIVKPILKQSIGDNANKQTGSELIINKQMNINNYVYYNIIKRNPIEGVPIQATFNSGRTAPILDRASDWKMAVVRFNIPANIPIFIAENDDILQQYYKVYLSWNNTIVEKSIVFIDPCQVCSYPRGVYNIQTWLNFINTAFEEAHNELKLAEPTYSAIYAPSVFFNPNISTKIGLYSPSIFIDGNTNNASIRMSFQLYNFGFAGLPSTLPSGAFSEGISLSITDNNFNKLFISRPPLAEELSYVMYSEFDPVSLFSQAKSFLFTTSSIPVDAELLGTSSQETRKVITDFLIPTDQPLQGQNITYIPPGDLRFYNLNSNEALREIDLSIFVQYTGGKNFPLLIVNNDEFSVKILFERRSPVEKFGFDLTESLPIDTQTFDLRIQSLK